MDPMSSGERLTETAQAAGGMDGAAAQADQFPGAIAVDHARGATARQTRGCARTGAETTMQTAAAVGHAWLTAAAPRARAGAATR